MCGAHPSNVAAYEWEAGEKDARIFQRGRDAEGVLRGWEDAVYNLARAHKTLRRAPSSSEEGRRRWRKRTPAMAAELTDHIWTIEELLTVLPLPMFTNN